MSAFEGKAAIATASQNLRPKADMESAGLDVAMARTLRAPSFPNFVPRAIIVLVILVKKTTIWHMLQLHLGEMLRLGHLWITAT